MNRLTAHALLFQPFPVTLVCLSVVVMGVGAAGGTPDPLRLALLAASIFGSHAAIAVLNELCDVQADRQAKPWKPLASGRVSPTFARAALALLVALMLASSALLGPAVFTCAVISTAAGFAYDLRLKGTPWALLCFLVGFGAMPPWAWLATSRWDPAALWVYPSAFGLVAGLHFADVLPDVERDLQCTGARALPHRLGVRRTLDLAVALVVGAALVGAVPAALGTIDAGRYLPGAAACVALGVAARAVGMKRRRVAYAALCLVAPVITVSWFAGYVAIAARA